jgi:hypothetical protein
MDEMDLLNERRSERQQKWERRPSKPEVLLLPTAGLESASSPPGVPIPNGRKGSSPSFQGGGASSPRRGSLGNSGIAGYPTLAHLLRYEVGSNSSSVSLLASSSDSPRPAAAAPSPSVHRHQHSHRFAKDRYINSKYAGLDYALSPFMFSFKFIYCRRAGEPLPGVDEGVDWERVERAIVPVQRHPLAPAPQACPICLDVPVLPRLTQCGHVFCQLCVLRLATLTPNLPAGSKWWRTCPVCWEEFHYGQVRPVAFVDQVDPAAVLRAGLPMDFVLLGRNSAMLLSEPALNRIQFAGPAQVAAWARDDLALTEALLAAAEPDSIDAGLLARSADTLRERLARMGAAAAEPVEGVRADAPGPALSADFVWFHQAADGQQLFLHPLTIKILKRFYGSYALLPRRLSAPLLEIDWHRIEAHSDVRKRLKHLAHLPVGTHYGLAELDLAGVVPASWLAEGGEFGRECLGRARERALRRREEEAKLAAFQRDEQDKLHAAIHSNILHAGGSIPDAYRVSLAGAPLLLLDDDNFPSVLPPTGGSSPPQQQQQQPLDIPKPKASGNAAGSFASVTAGTPPLLPHPSSSAKKKGNKGTLVFNNDACRQRSR